MGLSQERTKYKPKFQWQPNELGVALGHELVSHLLLQLELEREGVKEGDECGGEGVEGGR